MRFKPVAADYKDDSDETSKKCVSTQLRSGVHLQTALSKSDVLAPTSSPNLVRKACGDADSDIADHKKSRRESRACDEI
jgi:hypothetical protein